MRLKSDKIYANLLKIPYIVSKRNFLIYLPINNEVDTKSVIKKLIKSGAGIFLPAFWGQKSDYVVCKFTNFEDLTPGPFNILQPKELREVDADLIDVAILPGLAFDRRGVRLGYGRGVYDKLLKSFKGLKIGLAYDFQIVNELPKEEHDVTVDIVVGENLLIE